MERIKICSKCKQALPFIAFAKHNEGRDGLRPDCKICKSTRDKLYRTKKGDILLSRHRDYYQTHRDAINEKRRLDRKTNPAKYKAQQAEKYKKHRDKIRAAQAASRAANPEIHRARVRAYKAANYAKVAARELAWQRAHPEKKAARAAASRKANPEKHKKWNQEWQKSNPDKVNAQSKRWYKTHTEQACSAARAKRLKLPDSYIKSLLRDDGLIPSSLEIPQNLIKLKRVQLQITRKIKELKK